jgi:Omp85 superfamily domain
MRRTIGLFDYRLLSRQALCCPSIKVRKISSIYKLIWVEDIGATFSELWRRPSVGVGIGITYRLPIARVELNFGVPIVMRQGDWSRKGFQFGVGLEFM